MTRNQIDEVRCRRGMSVRALAQAADMADANLHRLLRPDHDTGVKALARLARVLDVPVWYLLDGYPLPEMRVFSEDEIARLVAAGKEVTRLRTKQPTQTAA